jgi:ABC-type sugar transport system ATPase subunit
VDYAQVLEELVTSGLIDHKGERQRARNHVSALQIKLPGLSTLVGRLSGGNQQKVVLAKWLEAGVRILLLDEPTRASMWAARPKFTR